MGMQGTREKVNITVSTMINDIQKKAKQFFDQVPGSHGWDHTLRVCALCERIGIKENADMDVLRMAALLHDIGRPFQDQSNGKICHARKGAEMARPILDSTALSEPQKNNILHCIKTHRFRGKDIPETCEARVLFDADKLDAIGAVGIARAYLFAGEIGARLHNPDMNVAETEPYSREDTGFREFKVKLIGIKDRMLTPTGREMARNRHEFMTVFFDRFLEEYQGKC
jgi:uncharacterized protein